MSEDRLFFQYYKNRKVEMNPQKINSCTKSILSILIGIALDKGYIKSISEPVSSFFPELINKLADTRKQYITIEDLLTMSAGFDWPEFGEWNFFAPMVFSSDIVKYVFERDLQDSRGVKMNYNSGCSHVLTAILQKTTGMKAIEFANIHLFKPLEITNTNWFEDNKGINRGADGLTMSTVDMLKIGTLILQEGNWKNSRIVSSAWLKKSTQPYYLTYESTGYYAYHWWVRNLNMKTEEINRTEMIFALGFGGQYICIIPRLKMVIAITSEIYEDSLKPLRIIEEFLINV
ncbi:serine hydrolase domain-containing protein [Paenibacillus pini]|uniref:Beta-lactamase class C and other penicillin binding proteins n=1 Tax=Paenibacillus pini JCM 16418 TaxID=1236976 RepID=W7YT99_9BACL|nr:serine hydrolase [Paenibacillus pini]GAF07851.1 beta-lactamase class C and other penicillin binding proteins [Paenibacillus pini JCM 16418]